MLQGEMLCVVFWPVGLLLLFSHIWLCACDPVDCSPPGSSVYGIFQARTLEWVVIPFSRGSSRPLDWLNPSPALATIAPWEALASCIGRDFTNARSSLVAQLLKNPLATWETWVLSLHWEDPLEKGKATHSSILAWRIPWTLQSMGSQRVGHDWATFTFKTC